MNVSCSMNEAEIKAAIALWFLQRHGISDLPISQITLKSEKVDTYGSGYQTMQVSANVTLNESFLQKLNKKNNEAVQFSGDSKASEDIFPPKKKQAKVQLDVE